MFRFFSTSGKSRTQKPSRERPSRQRQLSRRCLRFEQVEDRRLMAAVTAGPIADLPRAEGSIAFDPTTGFITVQGSTTRSDRVKVTYESNGDNIPESVVVKLENINFPRTASFDWTAVKGINFFGYGGDDLFDNRTQVPAVADGGEGRDVLMGGSGGDLLQGGPNNDYIDGRRGDDSLIGHTGFDAIFGDDGNDWLYGGNDGDFLYGGNGNDGIYGDAGSDLLCGGAGVDSLYDTSGTNKKYTDYGPEQKVTSTGFKGFDYFDKNLKDSDVRSLAREAYRDDLISRNEMLGIYEVIADQTLELTLPAPFGGDVSSHEVGDLGTMLSHGGLSYQGAGTRYLAGMVAFNDPANATFQGQPLGGLRAGSSAEHLNKLVDKWFFGADLPQIGAGDSAHYEFVSGTLFRNGIKFDDVDQGATDDSYFLAALGEVALRKPSRITDMITDNGDGTYVVKFNLILLGIHFVTVNQQLPVSNQADVAVYAGWGGGLANNPTNELWVALIEKAYAQLNAIRNIAQDGTNSYDGIATGESWRAFEHITGRQPKIFAMNAAGEAEMIREINARKGVTVNTKSAVHSALVGNHVYMVTSYNSATKRFSLFNPLGHNDSSPAVVEMSWSAIMSNCNLWTSAPVA